MTQRQTVILIVIVAAVAVGVVVGHLLLPVASCSWTVNRILHYACEGVAVVGAAGGIAFAMWPRPKPRRRDVQREQARRRVLVLLVCVVVAVGLAVFAELRREAVSRNRLSGQACADLEAIGKAIDAYAADHDGEHPDAIQDLVPTYLDPSGRYYAYRVGPKETPPPEAGPDAPPPAYALVERLPRRDGKPHADPVLAYLIPGHAWAPLTVVLEEGRGCRVVGDDRVAGYETQRKEKP